ncbi:YfiR family protein [Stieleria sp. ICT_E10.1]|uniref:YfiR family protein n=1 Tax=Stieleria sedimenti TaxID=2976331 RepID=UPI00217FD53A|nr:YfiR family protein [Stieleria sedimenti]MCS7471526.1 YfiR family protein [Stieleria sedimenti]
MRRSLSLFCALLIGNALIGDHVLRAQQPQAVSEYDIKAGWFAFFGLYIQWPEQPFPGADKDFVIGVLGNNPFGPYVRPSGNGFAIHASKFPKSLKVIQGKRIKVIEYATVDAFRRNYRPCHILFISRSSAPGVPAETVQDRVSAALAKTKNQSVVLVGEASSKAESEAFAKSGVIICYWNDLQDQRLKMVINDTLARNEGLKIKSPLLRLGVVTPL